MSTDNKINIPVGKVFNGNIKVKNTDGSELVVDKDNVTDPAIEAAVDKIFSSQFLTVNGDIVKKSEN